LSDSIEASAKRSVYNDYQFICGVDFIAVLTDLSAAISIA
jgi:hypothetical protein